MTPKSALEEKQGHGDACACHWLRTGRPGARILAARWVRMRGQGPEQGAVPRLPVQPGLGKLVRARGLEAPGQPEPGRLWDAARGGGGRHPRRSRGAPATGPGSPACAQASTPPAPAPALGTPPLATVPEPRGGSPRARAPPGSCGGVRARPPRGPAGRQIPGRGRAGSRCGAQRRLHPRVRSQARRGPAGGGGGGGGGILRLPRPPPRPPASLLFLRLRAPLTGPSSWPGGASPGRLEQPSSSSGDRDAGTRGVMAAGARGPGPRSPGRGSRAAAAGAGASRSARLGSPSREQQQRRRLQRRASSGRCGPDSTPRAARPSAAARPLPLPTPSPRALPRPAPRSGHPLRRRPPVPAPAHRGAEGRGATPPGWAACGLGCRPRAGPGASALLPPWASAQGYPVTRHKHPAATRGSACLSPSSHLATGRSRGQRGPSGHQATDAPLTFHRLGHASASLDYDKEYLPLKVMRAALFAAAKNGKEPGGIRKTDTTPTAQVRAQGSRMWLRAPDAVGSTDLPPGPAHSHHPEEARGCVGTSAQCDPRMPSRPRSGLSQSSGSLLREPPPVRAPGGPAQRRSARAKAGTLLPSSGAGVHRTRPAARALERGAAGEPGPPPARRVPAPGLLAVRARDREPEEAERRQASGLFKEGAGGVSGNEPWARPAREAASDVRRLQAAPEPAPGGPAPTASSVPAP
ncbi:basic proline-rich protein-like [Lepus europaeus]|uniref:basic proline-rich protein-like n=1 Tax=Lepus europaeus TaxID=9983 RepID=UPI002B4912F3|nr:basic proline-rich protein-like [Lepus europaeus]